MRTRKLQSASKSSWAGDSESMKRASLGGEQDFCFRTPSWMPDSGTIIFGECATNLMFNLLVFTPAVSLIVRGTATPLITAATVAVGGLIMLSLYMAWAYLTRSVGTTGLLRMHIISTLLVKALALPLALQLMFVDRLRAKPASPSDAFIEAADIVWRGMHAEGFLRMFLPQLPAEMYGSYIILRKFALFSYCTAYYRINFGAHRITRLVFMMLFHWTCSAAVILIVCCTCQITKLTRDSELGDFARLIVLPEFLVRPCRHIVGWVSRKNPFGSGNGINSGVVLVSFAPLVAEWSKRFYAGEYEWSTVVRDASYKFQVVFLASFLYSIMDIRTLDERARERHVRAVDAALEDFKHISVAASDRQDLLRAAGRTLVRLVPCIKGVLIAVREPIDRSDASKTRVSVVYEIHPGFAQVEDYPDLDASERVLGFRVVKDSSLLQDGLMSFREWSELGPDLGAARAITFGVQDAHTSYCTFTLFLEHEDVMVDHKVLRRFSELHANAARVKRTELAAKARDRVLEDLYPKHIAELMTAEASEEAMRRRASRRDLTDAVKALALDKGAGGGLRGSKDSVGPDTPRRSTDRPPASAAVASTSRHRSPNSAKSSFERTHVPGGSVMGTGTPQQFTSPSGLSENGQLTGLCPGLRSTFTEIHPAATILFADIVGYTALSRQLSPETTMAMLHHLYCSFDEVCEADSKVEKLDVIGDAYMCATGLNYQQDPYHARTMIRLAVKLLRCVRDMPPLTHENGKSIKFSVRIGINSGPLASGVMGRLRRKFTPLGDTVNVASRMESNGKPGQINMTEATVLAAGLSLSTPCLLAQTVYVKGVGDLTTYLLDPTDMDDRTAELLGIEALSSPSDLERSLSPSNDIGAHQG